MRDRNVRIHLTIVLIATLVVGVAACKADVVLDWNVIAADTLTDNGVNPFAGARYLAIVQLAVFEASQLNYRQLQTVSRNDRCTCRSARTRTLVHSFRA